MKITKDKLAKVIAEEVQAFLQEMKGPYAKMMRQQAAGDAYRSAIAQKSDEEDEAERARKDREFRKAQQAQKKSGEGLPDWMVEGEEDPKYAFWETALMGLKEIAAELYHEKGEQQMAERMDGIIKRILKLLQDTGEITLEESEKEPMRPRVDYSDTKSDKWDGPRTTTGRKFAKRVSNKKRRAQDKKATKED